MDLLTRYGLDPRYYWIKPGTTTLVMRNPPACPNGHLFGPGRVLLSTTRIPNPATGAGLVVTVWHCWECGADWSHPAMPGATHWPGVPVADDDAT